MSPLLRFERFPRALVALVALVALASPAIAFAQSPAQAIAITHVSVVDGRAPRPRADQTVVVRGDRIIWVGPAASARIPPGATLIDGRGRFLIPGLWDMHVHTVMPGGRKVLPLYIANGVTGVRDMAGDLDTLRAWRSQITAGTLVGPRLVVSGPYLEGGDQPIPHVLARTPDEGRTGVDSLVTLGVDFIKVHTQLRPETFYAIARRARERGIWFSGHVARVVGAGNASDSGQRSIEHLLAVPLPCTPAESIALVPRHPVQSAIGRCSSEDQAPLYAKLVRNHTWVTPTFVAAVEVASWPGRVVPGDSLAPYLPAELKAYVAGIFPIPDSFPSGADSVGRAMLALRLAQATAMRRAGVGVLAGTDAPLRNSPPGFGLHEELTLFVRGGMTPLEALVAATLEPARYFERDSTMGTVETGKVADLVLLAGDPLEDIANVRRIVAVIAAGRLYDEAARRALLTAGTPRAGSRP